MELTPGACRGFWPPGGLSARRATPWDSRPIADDESFSFFGRVTQEVHWPQGFNNWLGKLHWGTKNCAGIVVGGLLEGEATRSPAPDTSRENALTAEFPAVHSPASDKRWAIREAAARIDFIWVLSDIKNAAFPPDLTPADSQSARIQDEDSWGRWSSSASRPAIQYGPQPAPADPPGADSQSQCVRAAQQKQAPGCTMAFPLLSTKAISLAMFGLFHQSRAQYRQNGWGGSIASIAKPVCTASEQRFSDNVIAP